MTCHVALQFVAKTDTGLVRSHNEDAVELAAKDRIAVLADGMGGYNAGEVASGIATAMFRQTLEQRLQSINPALRLRGRMLKEMMVEATLAANQKILQRADQEPQFSGMGTTLVAALFYHEKIVLAHVGDSRAYRFRQGKLKQLTRDHSQLQEQIDAGLVSPEWARFAPNKNLITRALGVAPQIEVETDHHGMENDDIYLLCSDGLSDMLSGEQMADLFNANARNIPLLCERLVEEANNNGGRDNISVILVKVQMSRVAETSGWRARLQTWLDRMRADRALRRQPCSDIISEVIFWK
jgi:protein phosphatase